MSTHHSLNRFNNIPDYTHPRMKTVPLITPFGTVHRLQSDEDLAVAQLAKARLVGGHDVTAWYNRFEVNIPLPRDAMIVTDK